MAKNKVTECEICGEQSVYFETNYDDMECSNCGQKYYYEEGSVIDLTNEQKQVLKEFNLKKLNKNGEN